MSLETDPSLWKIIVDKLWLAVIGLLGLIWHWRKDDIKQMQDEIEKRVPKDEFFRYQQEQLRVQERLMQQVDLATERQSEILQAVARVEGVLSVTFEKKKD